MVICRMTETPTLVGLNKNEKKYRMFQRNEIITIVIKVLNACMEFLYSQN